MDKRYMWLDGSRIPWEDANVHVWDDVAVKGTSAFEGLICAWQEISGTHVLIGGEKHFRRLQRSASLIDLQMPCTYLDLIEVLTEASSLFQGQDFYARPTTFLARGPSGAPGDIVVRWWLGSFAMPMVEQKTTFKASISWPSRSGSLVPPTAKTGGSFLDFRPAEKNRKRVGAHVSVYVDPEGNIVEADGSGLMSVNDGEIIVPETAGHALDSITRRILVSLAEKQGFRLIHRRVHWSEAHGSILILGGTLNGVRLAVLDEATIDPLPRDIEIASALRANYYDFLRDASDMGWMTQKLESKQ